MFVFLKNLLSFKCPRCHEGKLFVNKWYSFPNGNKMVERCSICGQRTELEPGFFQGTGYVSYGLTVGFSLITFAIWVFVTGYTLQNKEIFWWLPVNIFFLILYDAHILANLHREDCPKSL
jgi:uncharacterized protein (DUF983 family)